jgi:hypothetical protein
MPTARPLRACPDPGVFAAIVRRQAVGHGLLVQSSSYNLLKRCRQDSRGHQGIRSTMNEHGDTRWLYYDGAAPAAAAHHDQVLDQIDAWWRAFRGRIKRLEQLFSGKGKWDLPLWMERHLQAIDPRLMWEFGTAARGKGHRLVITPEWAKHLRPLTNTILERAPRIKGWTFLGYRPPENLKSTRATVEGRTGGDISDVVFQARVGKHHLIDLTLYSPRTLDADDHPAGKDALVAVETLLGEERLEKWIGVIDVAALAGGRKRASLLPLDKLRARTEALISQMTDQLPAQPFHERMVPGEWALFKMEPEEADDYPAQADLRVGKSASQPLWIAAHSGVSFVSERFSKCRETFCYVKIDCKDGLGKSQFKDKSDIEDALDAALQPVGLGCHMGGGTGRRYGYIDLALTDVNKGINAVRDCLRQGNVPLRSWILFFDDHLAGEWIGVHEQSPPPPMPEAIA